MRLHFRLGAERVLHAARQTGLGDYLGKDDLARLKLGRHDECALGPQVSEVRIVPAIGNGGEELDDPAIRLEEHLHRRGGGSEAGLEGHGFVLIHGPAEDARIAVDLARSGFAAYERILKMIDGLWEAKTIPRMDYIKAKYDRDAAELELERADLILERQSALLEQYRLICNGAGSEMEMQDRESAIRKAYLNYRRADCGAQAKAIEVAASNLEYYREYLKKILELREENFATHTQVILAELDVELEEKSLADAKRRTATCRTALAELEREE